MDSPDRVYAAVVIPPAEYADHAGEIHQRLVAACETLATERGMHLPPEIELLTEDAWRDRFGPEDTDHVRALAGACESGCVMVIATAIAEAGA